jgi:hypothetical protein
VTRLRDAQGSAEEAAWLRSRKEVKRTAVESNWLEWRAGDARAFGRRPLIMRHRAHQSPLFSEEGLIRLIDATPQERIHVNTMARSDTDPRRWREGDLGDLTGREVVQAVARGNLWLHLRRVQETDPAYGDLLHQLFEEIDAHIPGHRSYRRSMSVLVSSPRMSVACHCDVPGQSLWHVRGEKRAFVYPARAPFLPHAALEDIILKRCRDTELPFDPAFDSEALIVDMVPGDWASWPRSCPHRIVNGDSVNVSFTTEHWTHELRAGYAVDYANGLLRPWFGGEDLSRSTQGPGAMAKLGLAAAHKFVRGPLSSRRSPRLELGIDFRVDPHATDGFVDISPYQVAR